MPKCLKLFLRGISLDLRVDLEVPKGVMPSFDGAFVEDEPTLRLRNLSAGLSALSV